MNFFIGQIFESDCPLEAVDFCNNSQSGEVPCYIKEIEPLDGKRRFQIVTNEQPTKQEINQQKIKELNHYLFSTDWYAVRYAETGVEIPQDVRSQRQSAREEISNLRESIHSS